MNTLTNLALRATNITRFLDAEPDQIDEVDTIRELRDIVEALAAHTTQTDASESAQAPATPEQDTQTLMSALRQQAEVCAVIVWTTDDVDNADEVNWGNVEDMSISYGWDFIENSRN